MLVILYICFIFGISLIPGTGFIGTIHSFGIDKVFHFTEYFILGLIFYNSVRGKKGVLQFLYILIILVPIIDEYLIQNFSGRSIDIFDFLANLIGLYTGICVWFIRDKYFDKKTYN